MNTDPKHWLKLRLIALCTCLKFCISPMTGTLHLPEVLYFSDDVRRRFEQGGELCLRRFGRLGRNQQEAPLFPDISSNINTRYLPLYLFKKGLWCKENRVRYTYLKVLFMKFFMMGSIFQIFFSRESSYGSTYRN